MDPTAAPNIQLGQLMDGYLVTQLLFVAADLGVADALADGPRTAESVAADAGVDPAVLHRMLRGLAAYGVLDELGDGRFGLTPTGELLRDGVPGSFRGLVLARGELYYGAFGRLRDAVRTGGNGFELAYGARFFDYLAERRDITAAFQASMTDRSRQEAAAVVAAYDFGKLRRLVDVGGGRGVLLNAILTANPGLAGVLFDQPEIVAKAVDTLPASCQAVGGDFFHDVPAGADAYLLSRVIHDWDDDEAARILSSCRKAMPRESRLLLVEAVLPERAVEAPAAVRMDLHMLAMFSGRERTEAEFADLFAVAGLQLDRVIVADETVGLHILEAVPG